VTEPFRIVFCDVEATGLNPAVDQVISYCIQVWQDGVKAPPIVQYLWPQVVPPPEVCAINGFSVERWQAMGARYADQRDRQNFQLLDGVTVGGHNVQFDLDFIAAECTRLGTSPIKPSYRKVDTCAICMPIVALGKSKAGLANLAAFFGIPNDGAHSCDRDVEMTIAIWEKFIERELTWSGF
jgi:DNA polymerase III epsilon subunit-like protein